MVDKPLVAARIASVRDAVKRIRECLPADIKQFEADRTAREVVTLNLFVALQDCVSLATHWIADSGWDMPQSYRELFFVLAERGVLERGLGDRMGSAVGLHNLIGHRYAALDMQRLHAIATYELDDLLAFCRAISEAAQN